MKNAYAKEQAKLRRQLLNYGALVGQQFNVDMRMLASCLGGGVDAGAHHHLY